MILIRQELFADLAAGGKDAVCRALQTAIELEHSTIPPYLYALYSLDPARNGAIAEIIQSVVVEEMLHMTLACNVLNALGGEPAIDKPGFIPTYPGPLPGSVESELCVGLAPFSLALVNDVFMVIEQPEDPLQFPVETALASGPRTIGDYYALIKEKVRDLGDGAFCSTPRNQVGPDFMDEAVVVTSAHTAIRAIDTIVGQGEGTTTSPLETVGKDYAHYYRFAEIYHGKRLITNDQAGPSTPPDERYVYAGAPVQFDAAGVFAAPANPRAATYPAGSAARYACDTFNYTYTSLLKVLHTVFNGQPDRLDAAISLMMSLKEQAIGMMSGAGSGGASTGPSFEYLPVNA